jgi:cyclopropane fatty-acyl-phospholipid synthase-like methyltransferase
MLRRLWFIMEYYKNPVWDTGTSPPELLSFIATHNPGRALDLGCGTGTNVVTLAKSGWQVTGVDYVSRAIRIAQKKAQKNSVKVELLQEDVTHLDSFSGKFDLILDMGCFHSLMPKDHSNYIAAVHRLLAKNGTYLLYVFIKGQLEAQRPGVTEEDIIKLTHVFKLMSRVDGTERDIRPSAWLSFQNNQKYLVSQ